MTVTLTRARSRHFTDATRAVATGLVFSSLAWSLSDVHLCGGSRHAVAWDSVGGAMCGAMNMSDL